jgi:hypothetical protein
MAMIYATFLFAAFSRLKSVAVISGKEEETELPHAYPLMIQGTRNYITDRANRVDISKCS